jgi:Leucine-rich repeat (LRR) protein
MLLTYLAVSNTKVTDLAPLKGMPLTSLWCNESPVTDLSPLQGMPLANLHCVDTRISDLLPLKDCRSLTELRCSKTKVTPATVAALKKSLPNCKIDWDDPAKAAKPKLAYLDPAFQQWVAETQKLSAQQQIEAVSKKLMELNLGFDGKLMGVEGGAKPKIKNGAVTELGLYAFDVADISPVRALSGLKSLGCYGDGPRRAKLSDLSPLAGMQLTSFYCAVTYVSDLAPLKGMPLIILYCFASPVADLSPVEGMPLVSVNITYTNISDLSPLKGAELKDIAFFGSKVTDISVLRGMPLEKVHNVAETVSDFSPFYDCKKLQSIWLKGGKFPSAQVAALQNALPNCKIVWDDPAKPQTTEPAPSGAK